MTYAYLAFVDMWCSALYIGFSSKCFRLVYKYKILLTNNEVESLSVIILILIWNKTKTGGMINDLVGDIME